VRILDPSSGAQLDKLTARSPQKWSGNTYVDWDQTIAPLDDFAASSCRGGESCRRRIEWRSIC
jgi:hypothetical protein